MPRFQTGGDERYVWHPAVHGRYGEECFFYLLRASDPASHVRLPGELNKLFRREDITSHSIYALFGYHDALIRLWGTETVRRRFLKAINRSSIRPEELLEFRTASVSYAFAPAQIISEAEVRTFDREIRVVVEADEAERWTPEAETAFTLVEERGLVHRVPETEGIKIYLLLAATSPKLGVSTYDEGKRLYEAMQEEGFKNVSLYSGSGTIGDYLLKGVVDDEFGSIWGMVTPIHRLASEFGLRATTLLIANLRAVVESDAVDNVRARSLPQTDELHAELAELLHATDEQRERLRQRMRELTSAQSDALVRIYESVGDRFRGSSAFQRLMRTLAASLLNDPDGVVAELAFLTYIERDLRVALLQLMRQAYGEYWFARISEILAIEPPGNLDPELDDARAREQERLKFSRLTLHDLFILLRAVAKESTAMAESLAGALGQRWAVDTRAIEELRNDFAHGRIVDRSHFSDFDGTWGAELERVMLAAKFAETFRSLRDAADEPGVSP